MKPADIKIVIRCSASDISFECWILIKFDMQDGVHGMWICLILAYFDHENILYLKSVPRYYEFFVDFFKIVDGSFQNRLVQVWLCVSE